MRKTVELENVRPNVLLDNVEDIIKRSYDDLDIMIEILRDKFSENLSLKLSSVSVAKLAVMMVKPNKIIGYDIKDDGVKIYTKDDFKSSMIYPNCIKPILFDTELALELTLSFDILFKNILNYNDISISFIDVLTDRNFTISVTKK